MRVGWFFSVRQQSVRFPQKSYKKFLNDNTIPVFLYERFLSFIDNQDDAIHHNPLFIIPCDEYNIDLLQSLAPRPYFIGDSVDLIKRHLDCALRHGVQFVVRITCDDPCKDFSAAYEMLKVLMREDLHLITNEHSKSYWVEGTTIEIYSTQLLRFLYFNAWTSFQREHIDYNTILQYSRGGEFYLNRIKLINDYSDLDSSLIQPDLSSFSLTVDTPNQFTEVQHFCATYLNNCSYDVILQNKDFLPLKLANQSSTKSDHFPKLRTASTSRSSSSAIQTTASFLEGDLRGSLTKDSVVELERRFCEIFNCQYAVCMSNGTVTLENSLRAIGISHGDHVLVPNLTMAATALSVVSVGAIPIFCDVDKETLLLSPSSVSQNITSKTKAVISVSLYGAVPDLKSLHSICSNNNISLIEDNAESLLSTYHSMPYGVTGDISSFSFQSTKHLTSFEGGIALTNDSDLALQLRRYSAVGYSTLSADQTVVNKNLIQDPSFIRHLHVASNSRMSGLTASLALSQLSNLDHLVNVRVYCAESYIKVLRNYQHICYVQNIQNDTSSSYWALPFVFYDHQHWSAFRSNFIRFGGLPFYSAWLPNSDEPAFIPDDNSELLRRFGDDLFCEYTLHYHKSDVSISRWVQKRLVALRTNLWNTAVVPIQCEILDRSLSMLS